MQPLLKSLSRQFADMCDSCICPVIMNSSLQGSGFLEYLGTGLEIIFSSNTLKDSIILSSCGVAILIVDMIAYNYTSNSIAANEPYNYNASCYDFYSNDTAHDASPRIDKVTQPSEQFIFSPKCCKNVNIFGNGAETNLNWELLDDIIIRIENFMCVHKSAVVIFVSSLFTIDSFGSKLMFQVQKRLLPISPMILLAHGEAQVASHIKMLSKMMHPDIDAITESHVDETLASALNQDVNFFIARQLGLNSYQSAALMDTFGDIENVARASVYDICQYTPLDALTSATIVVELVEDGDIL